MNLRCALGLHSRDGCKCVRCGKLFDTGHDWSKDCGSCAVCGMTRNHYHDWSKDCQTCAKCGKHRTDNWEKAPWPDCTIRCSQCHKPARFPGIYAFKMKELATFSAKPEPKASDFSDYDPVDRELARGHVERLIETTGALVAAMLPYAPESEVAFIQSLADSHPAAKVRTAAVDRLAKFGTKDPTISGPAAIGNSDSIAALRATIVKHITSPRYIDSWKARKAFRELAEMLVDPGLATLMLAAIEANEEGWAQEIAKEILEDSSFFLEKGELGAATH